MRGISAMSRSASAP